MPKEDQADLFCFDLDETWGEGLECELREVTAEFHKKYPVAGLQITDRRKWQKFSRDLAPSSHRP